MVNSNNYAHRSVFTEKGVDIISLLELFWDRRRFVAKMLILSIIICIIVICFTKDKYQSSSILVPQTSGISSAGSLGGLAALAGLNLGALDGGAELAPELYPKIFNSLYFQKELLHSKLTFEEYDDPLTFQEFYTDYYDPGLLAALKKYTIGLPGVIAELIKYNDVQNIESKNIKDSIPRVSKEERKLIDLLADQISIEINGKEGYITISGIMPDPLAAAKLADNAKNILQKDIIAFQIEKAKAQLDYLQNRLQEKKEDFIKAQLNLARYKDRNLYTNTARSSTELERLQAEYDLTFSVYSELAQQVEGQLLKVKQNTPVFTVIQPAVVPDKSIGTSKIGLLVIYPLIALIVSFIIIFLRTYIGYIFGRR